MEDKSEFLDIVQRINKLIREEAVERLGYNSLEEIKANSERFYSEVHSDFQIAQNLILENLIKKEEQLEQLKSELKLQRKEKKDANIKDINSEIWRNNFRQNVFRKLADSIAWQLIKGQHYIARRFYIRAEPPIIKESNITDVKRRVDIYNKEDSQSFALINDLTSFLQIGDILRKTPDGLFIIEAKEGEMNDIARNILDYVDIKDAEELKNIFPDTFDEKLKTQILRMHRQDLRANRAVEVINNEEGIDPYSEKPIKVFETETELDYYYDEIKILIHESRKKNWAYSVIDDCLHIGAYRNEWRNIGKETIERIVYEISGKKIPAFSLLQNLLIQISEPIFLKPFDDSIIRELLSGEVHVFMAIDFDKVIELFNKKGVSAKWLSRKETHKLKENEPYANELLIFENRAIGLTNGADSGELASGFLTRIISDNIYPRIAIDLFVGSYQVRDAI
jgi:hypothetical protein